MDITESTRSLNSKIQQLKSKFSDPASILFIDFYCQCKQGCDYLFPAEVKKTVRLFDILQLFFDCVEQGHPTTLVQLMWKDVAGPTLSEYREDEAIEKRLRRAFQDHELKAQIQTWDRGEMNSIGLNLILRDLLKAISQLELEQA